MRIVKRLRHVALVALFLIGSICAFLAAELAPIVHLPGRKVMLLGWALVLVVGAALLGPARLGVIRARVEALSTKAIGRIRFAVMALGAGVMGYSDQIAAQFGDQPNLAKAIKLAGILLTATAVVFSSGEKNAPSPPPAGG